MNISSSTPKKGINIVSLIFPGTVLLVLIGAFVVVKQGFDNTMTVKVDSTKQMCGAIDCLDVKTRYENNWLKWNVNESIPLVSFKVTSVNTYAEGTEVHLYCPIELDSSFMNHFITKLKFINNSDLLTQCKQMKL